MLTALFTNSSSRSSILTSLLLAGVIALAPAMSMAKTSKASQKPAATYNQTDSTYQYVSAVFDKLQTFWSKQALDQRMAANSVISFRLDRGGNVISSRLDSPSSSDGVANNALNYIKQAAPFGQMPESVTGQNIDFKFKLAPSSLQLLSYRFDGEELASNDNTNNSAAVTNSPTSPLSTNPTNIFYARVLDLPAVSNKFKAVKAPNTSSVKANDEQAMDDYVTGVRNQITSQWRQPNETVTTGPAMAQLQIDRDGTLLSATLAQSSGNKEVDRAILNTIYQSVPFAPAPKQVQSLPVTIQYVFEPVVNTVYVRQNNLP
jgi:TonB family protein